MSELIKRLVDVKTASSILSISQPTLRRLVKSGLLKHHRIGDRILFDDSDITTFIESCAVNREGSI